MCKALSHDIEITSVRLLEKSGGRRAFARRSVALRPMDAPLYGLVLAGGRSTPHGTRQGGARCTRDKPSSSAPWRCSRPHVERAFVSVRADQQDRPAARALRADRGPRERPRSHRRNPGRAGARIRTPPGWCSPAICRCSMRRRCATCSARARPARLATAYRSSHDGLPEPLCAIYEPSQPRGA